MYKRKKMKNEAREVPELTQTGSELIEKSIKFHASLSGNCISRFDFRYNEETNKTYLLEVNTQPGLTKNSLLPEMAREKGISFLKLCKILLKASICEI